MGNLAANTISFTNGYFNEKFLYDHRTQIFLYQCSPKHIRATYFTFRKARISTRGKICGSEVH